MKLAARYIEFFMGVFFAASAASKAVNMEGFQVQIQLYGVVKDPGLVFAAAYGTVLLETLLGALFMVGLRLRGAVAGTAALLTLVFSALIFYAWRWNGLEDCGCFGDYIKLSPLQSLAKNAALLGVIAWAWYGARGDTPSWGTRVGRARYVSSGMALGFIVLTLFLYYRPPVTAPKPSPSQDGTTAVSRPFAQFVFEAEGQHYDLGAGAYLVAMLNADCPHCRASVPMLNELFEASGDAEVVGLVSGTPGELEDFKTATEPIFAVHGIGILVQMPLLKKSPPELIHVVDGHKVAGWDWKESPPPVSAVLESIQSTPSSK